MTISKYLDPKNDIAFKKIFGTEKNKDILIHFLNDVLGFSEEDKIINIEFCCPFQIPDNQEQKTSIVDILCEDEKGIKYIVEMQVLKHRSFEKRAQYYASKSYSSQAMVGDQYYKLKKVLFIGIANCVIFPNKTAYKSRHLTLDEKTLTNDLEDLKYTFIELPKFNKNKEEIFSLEEKWYYFFKHAQETTEQDLLKIIGNDTIIRKAYTELDKFHWTQKELLAYEEIRRIEMDRIALRDQELYDIEEKKKKFREEGREEEREEIAKRLLKAGCEIGMIVEATGLSKEQIENLRDCLKSIQE
ncbi:MAG: Rpn family recombination-promoting nuclease/putative transposase [Chlamydiales bacterium]|jgi:predicted transposase/invertase (TIGR01784 family)|nr:Rpn family recombination-promoting nuclease/putative transposase [Chlamydiales bacterium]